MPAPPLLTRSSPAGRGTLIAVTLGSGVAILDGSVVNVALATIGTRLHASLAQLQWVVNGYLLALAALVLVGGSLGDRLGRRRVYLVGIAWFAVGSALCALAPNAPALIGSRVLQGVGGALLTPGALAVIQSSFVPKDRAPAIGWWAGTSGIATAIGPVVGGLLVGHAGWRWIFWINVPLCAVVVLLCLRFTPQTRDAEAVGRFDVAGSLLAAAGLALLTEGLTAASWPLGTAGIVILAAFVAYERRPAQPLVPPRLFRDRVFSSANAMTFLVYGALGAVTLFLVLQLQVSSGWSPLAAGLAALPVTIVLMALSSRAAALSDRIGPRLPMSLGPLLCAAGTVLLSGLGRHVSYAGDVLPGIVVFALGLALLVSPLTATVLAAAPERYAGVASGVNNAVARAGSLLAIAALPALVGLSGAAYRNPVVMTAGYRSALLWCAGLLAAGGVVSWVGLAGAAPERRRRPSRRPADGSSATS